MTEKRQPEGSNIAVVVCDLPILHQSLGANVLQATNAGLINLLVL